MGHLNWLLNVLPWGHPALLELYHKISGKSLSSRGVFINAEVKSNLLWLASIIPRSISVRFVNSGQWIDSEADLVVWTDASLHLALSFVYCNCGFVYQPWECPPNVKIDIFFLELVAIMSAIHHIGSFTSPPKRILLFTNSLDAMAVFNSLHANEAIHNSPLLGVASIILCTRIDLWVRHMEGKQNIQADLLSRLLLEEFASKFPLYCIGLFDPPHDLLPAWLRECFWAHWAGVIANVPPAHRWSYLNLIAGLASFKQAPSKNQPLEDMLPVHVITSHFAPITHSLLTLCLNLDPMPQTLSWYIAYTSRFIDSGPKYLSGTHHFLSNLYPSFNTNHSHPLVQATISGSKKIWAVPVKQQLPLHTSHLQAFLEVSNSSNNYDDCLFMTIISCCFYGCHRIGELVSNNDTHLQIGRASCRERV